MDTAKFYNITGGPSLDRILDAFKYSTERRAYVGMWFSVVESLSGERESTRIGMENVFVTAIIRHDVDNDAPQSDGSGLDDQFIGETSWYTIEGRCDVYLKSDFGSKRYRFSADYDPKTRKGLITFYEA